MLTVNMLGKFQIMDEEGVLNDDNIRSTMLTKLLVYMIIHREQILTIDEITTALWQEEEIENPAGALKNLMYRLRNLLKKYFEGTEFIITNRGSYCWNKDVDVNVDVEEFERLIEKAKKAENNIEDAIHYYEKAIALYQGDFMTKIIELHWVVTLNTYYHSLFLSSVKGLAELYVKTEAYDELEAICNEAIKYDNVDEQLHYYLILARMKRNKIKLAMESYEKACKILNDELGIRKPAKLQEIYTQLLKMNKGTKAENIEKVQEDMTEESAEGVFFCGYPVFREIYRLEARKITRLGEAEYVLLLTMKSGEHDKSENDQVEQFRIKNAMVRLEDILKKSLRIGDVAAKYSDTQFVILLPACTYESGMLVANRIISKFYNENAKYRNMKIKTNLEEVAVANTIVS